jgi:hypothetical protein
MWTEILVAREMREWEPIMVAFVLGCLTLSDL